MVESNRKIIIIAGPNGAGKTTFANQILTGVQSSFPFVNADIIARGLNPSDPEEMAFHAGRLMLQRIEELVKAGTSFALETTLSGLAYSRSIPRWRSLGYRVELYFFSLSFADMAVERVSNRVSEGGHHIPENVIRRRFEAGLRNFREKFNDLVDSWVLYDNSGHTPIVLDGARLMTNQSTQEVQEQAYTGIDAGRALAATRRASIIARRRALENRGAVMICRNGEMVWETGPAMIFPEGVEAKICECGRVIVKDTVDPLTEEFLGNPRLERYK